MLEKVLWEDLEALVAVAAVTRGLKWVLGSLFIGLIVGCGAVDNTVSTPNGFSCNPTDAQVNTFQTTAYITIQQCLRCHGNASAEAQATRTRLKFNNSQPDMKTNFCVAYTFGQRSPSKALVTHPQDPRHKGNQYSQSELQTLIDWVDSVTLQ